MKRHMAQMKLKDKKRTGRIDMNTPLYSNTETSKYKKIHHGTHIK